MAPILYLQKAKDGSRTDFAHWTASCWSETDDNKLLLELCVMLEPAELGPAVGIPFRHPHISAVELSFATYVGKLTC